MSIIIGLGLSLTAAAETHSHVSASVNHSVGHGWGGGWYRPVWTGVWWYGPGMCSDFGPYGWGYYYPWQPYGLCGDPWATRWSYEPVPSGQPGVTYQWDPKTHRYVPTSVPAETVTAPSSDVFMYPRNGQSAEQQATDKFECHEWAAKQAGFDPTLPANSGSSPSTVAVKTIDYRRAISACLDGRGYSVQ